MNESNRIQLKIIVERAVRPIQASTSHKRKVREELLAHVSGVFEEEAKAGCEGALEKVAARFGRSTELTGQLQESVPASDGFHRLLDELWFRPSEPVGRRVMRYGAWYSLILMVFLPALYVWVKLSAWLVGAVEWPAEEARLIGGPVLLLDFFFFAFSSVVLIWVLVVAGRIMAARFHSQQEWQSLQIHP